MKNKNRNFGRLLRPFLNYDIRTLDIDALVGEAYAAGQAFAPLLIEKTTRAVSNELRNHDKRLQKLMNRDPLNFRLMAAVFRFSVSDAVLVNSDDEERLYLIAVRYSAIGQRNLIQAITWMTPLERLRLIKTLSIPGERRGAWKSYYRGAFASAALAKAMTYFEMRVRLPTADNDVRHKIDMFCESSEGRGMDLALQVKSKVDGTSDFLFSFLRLSERRVEARDEEVRRMKEGVDYLNGRRRESMVPVYCKISLPDVEPIELSMPHILKGAQDVLEMARRTRNGFRRLAVAGDDT